MGGRIQALSVSDGIGVTLGATPRVASDPPAHAEGFYERDSLLPIPGAQPYQFPPAASAGVSVLPPGDGGSGLFPVSQPRSTRNLSAAANVASRQSAWPNTP